MFKKVGLVSCLLKNSNNIPKLLNSQNCCKSQFAFVPKHSNCSPQCVEKLQKFVSDHNKIFVLTGAGLSTESGIPDYRSEGVGLYATSVKRPVQYKDFLAKASVRQSYWARNYSGHPRFSSFLPNPAHFTLAEWEKKGKIAQIVTQNVDRLHHKAGSENIVELHGSAAQVHCINCNYTKCRKEFQKTLDELNPHMIIKDQEIRPDADVDLSPEDVAKFVVPPCPQCNGNLKPFIVFYGDNVPKRRVQDIKDTLSKCDAFLALGTSMQTYSAFRFLLQAEEMGIACAAVNIGPTRGEDKLYFRIPARCGEILPSVIV